MLLTVELDLVFESSTIFASTLNEILQLLLHDLLTVFLESLHQWSNLIAPVLHHKQSRMKGILLFQLTGDAIHDATRDPYLNGIGTLHVQWLHSDSFMCDLIN